MKPRPSHLLLLASLSLVARAALAQDLTRYALGGNNQPRRLVNAPDGSLFALDKWVPSYGANPSTGYVLRIATDGGVTRLPITSPTTLAAGPDGNMWVAEPDKVHRITPLGHSDVPMLTVGAGWEPVAIGKALVFWRNSASLQLAYWQMAANRTIGGNHGEYPPNSSVKDASWSVVASGDFFGFGQLDLVWRRNSGEMVVWYLSQGYFIQEYRLATVSDPNWQVVTPR